MEIQSSKEKISLKIVLTEGMVDGKEKLKSKTYNKLKTDAENTSIYEAGTILSDLQSKELKNIMKVEESILSKGE